MQKNFLSNSEYKCKYTLPLLTLQIRKRITGSRLSLALRRLRMEDKFKGSMGCTAQPCPKHYTESRHAAQLHTDTEDVRP